MPSPRRSDSFRPFLRRLPLALVGAVVIWYLLRIVYNPALCAVTQFVARTYEVPPASLIMPRDDDALLGRSDLRLDSGWLKVSLTEIQFNIVPFLALVLALPRWFRGGAWRRVLLALLVLALSHVLGLLWHTKYWEAFSLGPWSRATYSDFARNVYGGLRYFFDIPVTFTLPLLLWVWVFPERVFALAGMRAPGAP
ncbi:MAG: hypothetical protein ACHQQS_12055 [Thermoanaerobaculales bacterium]